MSNCSALPPEFIRYKMTPGSKESVPPKPNLPSPLLSPLRVLPALFNFLCVGCQLIIQFKLFRTDVLISSAQMIKRRLLCEYREKSHSLILLKNGLDKKHACWWLLNIEDRFIGGSQTNVYTLITFWEWGILCFIKSKTEIW